MIGKHILFSVLVCTMSSGLASEADDATKPTEVTVAGMSVTHDLKTVFLSANKQQFLVKEENGTMQPISRDDAFDAMRRTHGGLLTKLQHISNILAEFDTAQQKQLQALSGQAAVLYKDEQY